MLLTGGLALSSSLDPSNLSAVGQAMPLKAPGLPVPRTYDGEKV
jgi:hypothetical protein